MIFFSVVIDHLHELSSVFFGGTSELKKSISVIVHITHHFYVSANVTFFMDTHFFATPVTFLDSTLQVLSILLIEIPVSTQRPPMSQSSPRFCRHIITYKGQHVRVPDIVSTNLCDLVQETILLFFGYSGSAPILSLVSVTPDPSVELPITLRKCKQSPSNIHSTYNCFSYHCLSASQYASLFLLSLFLRLSRKLYPIHDRQTMIDEMIALEKFSIIPQFGMIHCIADHYVFSYVHL